MTDKVTSIYLVGSQDGKVEKWPEKSVFWSESRVPLGCTSIPCLVESRGSELKRAYIDKIDELGKRVVADKTVVDFMSVSGFSFWHTSLLAQKSVWKTESIYFCFKLMVLESLIREYKVTDLHLINVDDKLSRAVSSLAQSMECTIHVDSSVVPKLVTKKSIIFFKSIGYWVRECWRYRGVMLKGSPLNVSSDVNILGYTSGMTWSKNIADSPDSIYWSGIRALLREKKVNWSLIFVPDAQHQQFSQWLINKTKYSKNKSHQVNSVEEEYSVSVMIRALVLYCKLAWRSQKALCSVMNSSIEREIWLNDWNNSFLGYESIRNCLKFELFRKLAKRHRQFNVGSKTLYVYENQPWELMLLHHWRAFKLGELWAFQHAGGKFFDMRPYTSQTIPLPDHLIVTGEGAKSELEMFDYSGASIIVAEAIRNLYLADIGKKQSESTVDKGLLVITDYLLEATKQQLVILSEAREWIEKHFDKVIIKPHPACKVDNLLKELRLDCCDNIKVVESPLSEIWQKSSHVYASNLTSAVIEAAYIGKPTIICLPQDGFNMSPLRGVEAATFVATKEQLVSALENENPPKLDSNYYCLNTELSQWKEIIG